MSKSNSFFSFIFQLSRFVTMPVDNAVSSYKSSCGSPWTVNASYLQEIVKGLKTMEGRPVFKQTDGVEEGHILNLGCMFNWVICRVVKRHNHNSIAEMCSHWPKLMPSQDSQEACERAYKMMYPQHADGRWVSFTLKVLDHAVV